MKMTLQERFEDKIFYCMSGCWIWMATSSKGYGNFVYNGRQRYAHRISFLLYKGYLPANLMVCHSCDVPLCVNPDHLFLGTASDNQIDMARKNRSTKWDKSAVAKLKIADIHEIRALKGIESIRSIAKKFNVSKSLIGQIHLNQIWIGA